jgi:hypothetical protein
MEGSAEGEVVDGLRDRCGRVLDMYVYFQNLRMNNALTHWICCAVP